MTRKRNTLPVNAKPGKPKTYTSPVQPLFENVVTIRKKEEKYAGAIIIPETNKEKPMGATVVAVGPDTKVIKVDDFVLIGRYAGADVEFAGEEYTILREAEILGIVRDEGD